MDARRGEQATVVVGQAEDRRAVGRVVAADALEHRRTVVQCVRHDVGGRPGPWLDGALVPAPVGVTHVGDSRWTVDHYTIWAFASCSPLLQHDPQRSTWMRLSRPAAG